MPALAGFLQQLCVRRLGVLIGARNGLIRHDWNGTASLTSLGRRCRERDRPIGDSPAGERTASWDDAMYSHNTQANRGTPKQCAEHHV